MTEYELYKLYEDNPMGLKRSRWVTIEEAVLLRNIGLEEKPNYIYESGTANGFSTMWLSLVGCSVMTFDPFSRPKVWDAVGGVPDNVTYIEAPFSNVVEKAHEVEGKKMFFIDGLHTSGGVKSDIESIKKVVKAGDVLVFHDLNEVSVFRFWARLIGGHNVKSYETYETKRVMGKLVWKDI